MLGKFAILLCIASLLCAARCQGPVVIDTDTDDNPADCVAACDNMEDLDCDGWQGSPGEDEVYGTEDDVSCDEICEMIAEEPTAEIFPGCVAAAETCEAVDECSNQP